MATEKRQRQKEGHRLQKEELRKWEQRRRSRRRLLTWGAVIAVAVALLFGYSALQGDDENESPTTTAPVTTTVAPATDTTAVTSTTAATPTTTTPAP
jgi:multidrug efflux pump subunit AcrA (membrane-fusion protein)